LGTLRSLAAGELAAHQELRQIDMAKAPENFAETVKEVRQQLGLSQEELAHELGVSFSTINRWENSKTVPFKLGIGIRDKNLLLVNQTIKNPPHSEILSPP
jgi:ribosome-binding protein aMBF1 (putative translation factor)